MPGQDYFCLNQRSSASLTALEQYRVALIAGVSDAGGTPVFAEGVAIYNSVIRELLTTRPSRRSRWTRTNRQLEL